MQLVGLGLILLASQVHCFWFLNGMSVFEAADDPEINLDMVGLVQYWGYDIEEYEVVTEDLFHLKIFRIPRGKNESKNSTASKPVILLQHGLLASSIVWINNLPHQDAAFKFADAGFDVWLGNFRGNKYGKVHEKLNERFNYTTFWNFSWSEMSKYDLPAIIDFILRKTNVPNLYYMGHSVDTLSAFIKFSQERIVKKDLSFFLCNGATWTEMSKYDLPSTIDFILGQTNASSLYYMGHSMGTLTAFVKFSQDRQFAKKVKKFYALAPIMKMNNVKGGFRWLVEMLTDYPEFHKIFREHLNPTALNWVLRQIGRRVCNYQVAAKLACSNFLFWVSGPDSYQFNITRMPIYQEHTPDDTSKKTLLHFAQMVKSGKIQDYDYGKEENIKRYGKETPPEFDISRMETPLAMFWGGHDYLADEVDVKEMIPKMKSIFKNVYLPEYNHLDFNWGLRAAKDIYDPIIQDIKNDLH